ncbi:tetratricopeptide repeat protein [candidate division KSB1 bacterium]
MKLHEILPKLDVDRITSKYKVKKDLDFEREELVIKGGMLVLEWENGKLEKKIKHLDDYFSQSLFRKIFPKKSDYSSSMPSRPSLKKFAKPWYELGLGYAKNGQLEDARYALHKSSKLDADNAKVWGALGTVCWHLKDKKTGLGYLKKSAKMDPKFVNPWLDMGFFYFNERDYGSAITALKKVIEIEPNNIIAWRRLEFAYEDNGQREESSKARTKVLQIDPNNARAWYRLGISHYQNKNYPKSIDSCKKAIDLGFQCDTIWNYLGRIYLANNQPDHAANALKKAVELSAGKFQGEYYQRKLGLLEREVQKGNTNAAQTVHSQMPI